MGRTGFGLFAAFTLGTLCGAWSVAANPLKRPEVARRPTRVDSAVRAVEQHASHRELSRDEIEDAAIEGIMMRFDPEGSFFNERDLQSFNETVTIIRASPSLGIRWERRLVVTRVDTGSDLERRGVRPGDELVELDGVPVDGSSFSNVFAKLAGPPRSHLRALIRLRSGEPPTEYRLPRFCNGRFADLDVL
jgi:C-terminal processing protease CtpA/Prc